MAVHAVAHAAVRPDGRRARAGAATPPAHVEPAAVVGRPRRRPLGGHAGLARPDAVRPVRRRRHQRRRGRRADRGQRRGDPPAPRAAARDAHRLAGRGEAARRRREHPHRRRVADLRPLRLRAGDPGFALRAAPAPLAGRRRRRPGPRAAVRTRRAARDRARGVRRRAPASGRARSPARTRGGTAGSASTAGSCPRRSLHLVRARRAGRPGRVAGVAPDPRLRPRRAAGGDRGRRVRHGRATRPTATSGATSAVSTSIERRHRRRAAGRRAGALAARRRPRAGRPTSSTTSCGCACSTCRRRCPPGATRCRATSSSTSSDVQGGYASGRFRLETDGPHRALHAHRPRPPTCASTSACSPRSISAASGCRTPRSPVASRSTRRARCGSST